jgi:hypothetical protein
MGKTAQRRAKAVSGTPRVVTPAAEETTPTAPPAIPYLAGTATETAVDALIDDPNKWKETAKTGTLTYGSRAGVFVSIGDPTKPPTVNAEEAWKLVISLGGDEAAQTLLYVMAKCLSNDNPLDKVRISVQEALTFRGLKRHRSRDFRPEQSGPKHGGSGCSRRSGSPRRTRSRSPAAAAFAQRRSTSPRV